MVGIFCFLGICYATLYLLRIYQRGVELERFSKIVLDFRYGFGSISANKGELV